MPPYDSYNHNKKGNKQLRSRVAENDETRRQRHRQHQEDHLKHDEYSLNQCNKSVSGKRCVDHKDNSRINVANEHSHVVDLTKPTQQTMLADGLSNELDSSSVVSPDLLKKCLSVLANYVHQGEKDKTPVVPNTENSTYQSSKPTQVGTELQKKKKVNKSRVQKSRSGRKAVKNAPQMLFEDKPIFLLEDACDTFRTASNGCKFIVKMQDTIKFGSLPIVVWKDDKRTEIEMIRQGRQHEKSRLKYLRDVMNQANQAKNLKVEQ